MGRNRERKYWNNLYYDKVISGSHLLVPLMQEYLHFQLDERYFYFIKMSSDINKTLFAPHKTLVIKTVRFLVSGRLNAIREQIVQLAGEAWSVGYGRRIPSSYHHVSSQPQKHANGNANTSRSSQSIWLSCQQLTERAYPTSGCECKDPNTLCKVCSLLNLSVRPTLYCHECEHCRETLEII